MNQADRKQVSELMTKLEQLNDDFEMVKSALSDLADAESEKFDNLSEGLQISEVGQLIETAADNLREAAEAESITEAKDLLEAII